MAKVDKHTKDYKAKKLTTDQKYQFRVLAVNKVGASKHLESEFVTPKHAPGNYIVTPTHAPGNYIVTPKHAPGNYIVTPKHAPGNYIVTPKHAPGN